MYSTCAVEQILVFALEQMSCTTFSHCICSGQNELHYFNVFALEQMSCTTFHNVFARERTSCTTFLQRFALEQMSCTTFSQCSGANESHCSLTVYLPGSIWVARLFHIVLARDQMSCTTFSQSICPRANELHCFLVDFFIRSKKFALIVH